MEHCKFCDERVLETKGFSHEEIHAAQAYCKLAGDEAGHFNLEKFREAYRGFFNTNGEFCREFVDQIHTEPDWIARCIDWDYAWDYAFQFDFSEFDGHYFWSGYEVIDPEPEPEVCLPLSFFHFHFHLFALF